MARILLIIGGGIAAYKAAELIRLARKQGHEVTPVLTNGGAHFVTPMSLAALAESPVYTSLWDLKDETEMGHIQLSRAADLVLDESLGAEPTEANVKVLRDAIERHVADEEQRIFPLAERLGATAQARLAARIERRADELEEDEDEEDPLSVRPPSE